MNTEADTYERPMTRRDLVERGPDAVGPSEQRSLVVSPSGAVAFSSMQDVITFAKLMSTAGAAIPSWLRGNPGGCLAVTLQASEWNMSPFSVAQKAYATNDRINYESQLIHAVVEKRAPLKERLRRRYEGEVADGTRVCIVSGTLKGESEPREYRTPTLGTIIKKLGRNDRGQIKGSPLWEVDPDTQLFYYGSRAWARVEVPDVLMGIYAPDEFPDLGEDAKPVEALVDRLKASPHVEEGFHADRPEDLVTIDGALADAGHQPREPKTITEVAIGARVESAQAEEPVQEPPKPKRTRKRRGEVAAGPREPQDAAPDEGAAQAPAQQEGLQAAAPPDADAVQEEVGLESIRDAAAYKAYASAWLMATPTAEARTARWRQEKDARTSLGVMGKDLQDLIDLGQRLKAEGR